MNLGTPMEASARDGPGLRKVFSASRSRFNAAVLVTIITSLFVMGSGIVTSVLLSRLLGPTGRGEVAAMMLWPSLLTYLASLGMISSTLYYSSLPDARTGAIFANSLAFAIVQSVIPMAVGYVALPYLLASQGHAVVAASRLFLLVIPVSLVTQACTSILQGQMKFTIFNRLRLLIPLGYLLGTVLLWSYGRLTLHNIVVLHLGLNAACLVGSLASLLVSEIEVGLRGDRVLARQMLRYGLQVQFGDISVLGNQRLDQILLAAWFTPAQLGLYVSAVSAASPAETVSSAVKTVITPELARQVSASARAATLERTFRRFWLISIPSIAALGLVVPFAIPLLFGRAFRPAVWPAEVLLVGAIFSGGKDVLTGVARALGRPWISSQAEFWGLLVSVLLLLAMLPLFGALGAALASLAAYATSFFIIAFGLVRSDQVEWRHLFPVLRPERPGVPPEFPPAATGTRIG